MNSAQKTTTNFVDFYSWVDSNGTRIWSSSNVNDTSDDKIKEFSTAAQAYFEKIKDAQVPAYSNTIKLTDGQSGILILIPSLILRIVQLFKTTLTNLKAPFSGY